MKKLTIFLQLFIGWTVTAFAQSAICHEDGTVTFQYKNVFANKGTILLFHKNYFLLVKKAVTYTRNNQ